MSLVNKTFALLFVVSANLAFGECPVLKSGMRVDSQAALQDLQSYCTVEGSVGIFLDGVEELTLPNLISAQTISIESFGLQAVSLPNLKAVRNLYVSGGQLEVAEFPSLQYIHSNFVLRTRHLKILNFPNLGRVGNWVMEGNLDLEFIFADSLYAVGKSNINNNPLLNGGSLAVIQGVTHVMTEEEKQIAEEARQEARELKRMLIENRLNQPPPAPTGHETHFNTVSTVNYYRWYPYYLNNYWDTIRPWGYHRYYYRMW